MQRLERLLDTDGRVPPVDLVQVDVLGTKSPETVVDLGKDGLPRKAAPFGPGRIGMNTFVATTTSSRLAKSLRARPTISSLVPSEYILAVSKKLIPSSTALLINGRLSSSGIVQLWVPRSGVP